MRRGGEQRFVEQVFPRAGKFAFGNELGVQGMRATTMAEHKQRIAHLEIGGEATLKRRRVELAQRLDQRKAGGAVIGERVTFDHCAAIGGEPNLRRLCHQIADGQHQAILADHCTVTAALGAEVGGGVTVRWHFRTNQYHRVERAPEIKLRFFRLGLQRIPESPLLIFSHGVILTRSAPPCVIYACNLRI